MSKVKLASILFASFFLMFLSLFTIPVLAQTCTDVDGDGYGLNGDASCPNVGVDCDDTDANVYPGAARVCDAKDNDCDGWLDFPNDIDVDGDGSTKCYHYLTGLKDCDDNNAASYPGNLEGPFGDATCFDGIDNDCDRDTDAGDAGCDSDCQDNDGDGYGSPGNVTCPNGAALDCDDTDAASYPGAADAFCNGVDNNCSGTADNEYIVTATACGVGECVSAGQLECQNGSEVDTCVAEAPQPEVCSGGLDEDCDGLTDGADPACGSCADNDLDGYGANNDPSCPNVGIDCNENDAGINPGAPDSVCNGVDNNCSGTEDSEYIAPTTNCGIGECATTGLLECQTGVLVDTCTELAPGVEGPFGDPTCTDTLDNDCDGLTDAPDPSCNPPGEDNDGDGFCEDPSSCTDGSTPGDCNDTNGDIYPGAPRVCDAEDSDCDGFLDFNNDTDNDGDGIPKCYHYQSGLKDCDDNDPLRSPLFIEGPFGDPTCTDSRDNDCDNRVDIADLGCDINCQDADGDGYGSPGNVTCPNGAALDCDDMDATSYPGAADAVCNGVDNNCSGTADNEYVVTGTACGTGECASTGQLECQSGSEVDTCVAGAPQPEVCSGGLDEDCDGLTDGADPACGSCEDNDLDGYGANNDPSCTNAGADCNDNDAGINPGAADAVCDGVDNNCSGTEDSEYIAPTTNCGIGECATTGLLECQTGALVDTCSALAPGVEGPFGDPTCGDLLDNDCDTEIDAIDNDCNPLEEDQDGDGFCEGPTCTDGSSPGDCNDSNGDIYPGAPRVCDAEDSDCDGFLDFANDTDADDDGVPKCFHYQSGLKDCDDNDPLRSPLLIEGPYGDPTCLDSRDNDCDNRVDIADSGCEFDCQDQDGDGYGSPGNVTCPNGDTLDCDDTVAITYPGAPDAVCNGVDNNCSGTADDEYVVTATACGTGECASTGSLTCIAGSEVDDCTPGIPAVEGPLGDATCSGGLDEDCDNLVDAADPGCQSACLDDDLDGYGVNDDPLCPNAGADCNDNDININPGAADAICNGVDDNCSGTPDNEYVAPVTNCGVGECATTGLMECQSGSLVDTCAPLAPGIEDIGTPASCTDTLDNDCDGTIDTNDLDCNPLDEDQDGDGFCEGPSSCSDGSTPGDCDDVDPQVYPGANATICDGKDTNCDGFQDFFSDIDADNDGYPRCADDCDDDDPNRSPGINEGPPGSATCLDSIDNDCDNLIDAVDTADCTFSCDTKLSPIDGPHTDLLNIADDTVRKTKCNWCHFDDGGTIDQRTECNRCHADSAWGGPNDGVLKDLYTLDPPYGFATAQNVRIHSSTVLGTDYGNWDMNCITCHNPHVQEQDNRNGTTYGKYIKEYICYDNPVTSLNIEEMVLFTTDLGTGSFADGAPHNENICEMCHTQTNYHRNDGSTAAHNDDGDCTECHLHLEGFKPSCGTCHEVPPPTGSHLKHYGGNPDFANYGNTGITEDFTAQDTVYIMNCGNCHPIDSANHQNSVVNSGGGDAQIELYDASAPAGSLKALNPPTATYTPGSTVFTDASGLNYTMGTCDNVYCHSVTDFSSSGDVPLPTIPAIWPPLDYSPPWESFVVKSAQYQTPEWGVDVLGCDGCHGYPITLPPTVSAGIGDSHAWVNSQDGYLNMHAWNMGYATLQCNICHYNTVQAEDPNYVRDDFSIFFNDIPIHNTAYHVNGTKDIEFNPASYVYPPGIGPGATYDLTTTTFFPAGTLYPNEATCVNAPCHQNQVEVKWGTPYREWLQSTECNVCHKT